MFTSRTNFWHTDKHCDPDQTAPLGAVWFGSRLFVIEMFQMAPADDTQRTIVTISTEELSSLCSTHWIRLTTFCALKLHSL